MFDTIPAHTLETQPAGVEVRTSPFTYDAGIQINVSLFKRDDGGFSPEQHTAHALVSFSVTPDEADELAAMLVAHAFDRRRLVAAEREQVQA